MKTKREASQLGIVSYDTALKALNGKQSISLCNNTTLQGYRCNDATVRNEPNYYAIVIRLHITDVVTYYPNGNIVLNSGGYRTVTTKDRMNRFSPFSVWQVNFEWYVSSPTMNKTQFSDGMIIPSGWRSGLIIPE